MKVQLTSEYEKERITRTQTAWELKRTTSLVEAARTARDMGWKEKKVQVRREGDTYYIEPFEKDCGCPNILKYGDFFE